MNRLLENGQITEMSCGTNFEYVLADNSLFLTTEYKVLQSQANSYFVKCMKVLYNGKVQMLYLTRSLKPFSVMLPSLDADSFLTITANLLDHIVDARHNGFLSCQNIDISFDKIFVDPTTYKVSLVYIPVSQRIYDDDSAFENEVRTGLVKLISGISELSSPKTMQLASDLSDGTLKMEDLSSRIRRSHGDTSKTAGAGPKAAANRHLHLIALNVPNKVEIEITKDRFVIGKNPSLVDGPVSFNKMISRVHCRIDRSGENYTVTDLRSANGTYVNRVRLQPNQPHPIKNGDIIRMANSDFQVKSV